MSNQPDLPFHLYQVLEEEYLSLQGRLSAEETVTLHGRHVVARLDWEFHAGHVVDAVAVRSNLDEGRDAAFKRLRRFLPTPLPAAASALNTLLAADFYDEEAFRHVAPGAATTKLLKSYFKADRPSAPGLRAHLNRLLLEDLFPREVEKISNIRLAAMYQRLHREPPAALCLSGGGIRSGTFALGLIQGLARHDLLKEFDYLSTVSGGGYIGSWLTAWLHRHPEGLEGVTRDLANQHPDAKIDPDPEPIRHLRRYSNFITPKVGLLSADTWAFTGIYLRNLLLNWAVIIPLVLAALMLPRFAVAVVMAGALSSSWLTEAAQSVFRVGFAGLGLALGVLSVAYSVFNRPAVREQLVERSRFWRKRAGQRGFLLWCWLPLLGASVLLTDYWGWTQYWHSVRGGGHSSWEFVAASLALGLGGWLVAMLVLRRYRRANRREFSPGEMVLLVALLATGAAGGALAWVVAALSENPIRAGIGDELATALNITVGLLWQHLSTELYACFAVPSLLLLFLLATTLFVGLASHRRWVTDEDREWWARFGAWVLIAIIVWVVFCPLVIFGPVALIYAPKLLTSLGGISGLVAVLAGRSAKTAATAEQQARGTRRAALGAHALPVLATVFLAVFVALLSLGTSLLIREIIVGFAKLDVPNWLTNVGTLASFPDAVNVTDMRGARRAAMVEHLRLVHLPSVWFVLWLMTLLFGGGVLLAKLINLNLFSLHGGYRNRLIRGYLAASRGEATRHPNPFTGFDPADNISMHELRPALLRDADFIDFARFAARLQKAGDNEPHAQYLKRRLSRYTRDLLDAFNPAVPPAARLRVALTEDLNRILEDEQQPLFADEHFVAFEGGVGVPADTTTTTTPAEGEPPLPYHVFRSRYVLEQAFAGEIAPCRYPPHRLLHVVNTALNLVGGDNLAWQQRKAESFSVSPLHSGCYRVGYRRSRDYGGEDGISLGTAIAISGAAASSNMGYYSTSPVLSLVMTLFNVRLGWWLGNPGPAGADTYRRMSPMYSVIPVIEEAFGLTDDKNDYVYLTDGGHFENLALYEMVLRRCRTIIVSDGGCDGDYSFNDLGNALRKIRIDLGVPVEFADVPIYAAAAPADGKRQGCYWAIGKIRYTCVDQGSAAQDGVLIYIKPAVYGEGEPRDVLQYKQAHPAFPHESTADQFFDEPQFESYRMLGSFIADRICGENQAALTLAEFVEHARGGLVKRAPHLQTELRWLQSDTGTNENAGWDADGGSTLLAG